MSTYYVATSGSDSNAGTSDAIAFRTLQHAADAVKAGDNIIVRAGTYAGMNLYGKAGGTQAAPIKFLADPGAKVTHVSSSGVNSSLADINVENTGVWIIKGFDVESDGSEERGGIRVANSSYTQILNNTVNLAFIGIFTSNSDNLLVQGNTCTNSTDQHGIYMSANEHGCVVRGNTLYGNNWDGLHMNALVGSPNDGALVEDNVIYGNDLSGMDLEGITNATFRNNVIYGNGKHGITIHSQDQDNTPAAGGNVFVNNTILNNAMFGVQIQPADINETLFNNILLSDNSTYGSIGVSGTPTGLISDYNVVSDDFSIALGDGQDSLAQWQVDTGQDLHSIVATPSQLFLNASLNPPDFHLKVGSAAVDRGTASLNGYAAAPADFDNNARPQGAGYDIGAYEYPASDIVPPTVAAAKPAANATNVAITAAITATFSEAIQSSTLSLVLRDPAGNVVAATLAYNSRSNVATLTPSAILKALTQYTVTVSGAQDIAGNTMSPATWSFTTTVPDTTPPAVTSVDPGTDSAPVQAGSTSVKVTFSESIQPGTLNFVLDDSGGNPVAATIAYDDSTHTATLRPNLTLAYNAAYTVIVSGAKDLSGNAMTSRVTWSFATAALGTGPFQLFPSNPTPSTVDDSDVKSTEVGAKFYCDVSGFVTGVRFYKGPTNTGTHVGHLWDASGNLLASVTFTNESASGWQRATFSSPIPIQADQIYVISYLAPNGRYAEDDGYFTSSGIDSGPLHAPPSGGVYGVNGVYAYAADGAYPTQTYLNANYWVDPILLPAAQVEARYAFYNNSYFDGNDPAAAAASDVNAIATDKQALLPGQTATFRNYTSYSKGINGIMIDVDDLPANGSLSPTDFAFLVGNNADPTTWVPVLTPTVTIFRGQGVNGSDRIELTWPDGTITDKWLQVTMLATANTRLVTPDVFYFGNAIGETGNSATDAFVDGTDFAGARDNPANFLNRATIGNVFDFNRDSFVDAADVATARDNTTNFLTALKLITASAAPAAPAAPASTSATSSGPATTPVVAPVDPLPSPTSIADAPTVPAPATVFRQTPGTDAVAASPTSSSTTPPAADTVTSPAPPTLTVAVPTVSSPPAAPQTNLTPPTGVPMPAPARPTTAAAKAPSTSMAVVTTAPRPKPSARIPADDRAGTVSNLRIVQSPSLPSLARFTAQQMLLQGWSLDHGIALRSPRDHDVLNT